MTQVRLNKGVVKTSNMYNAPVSSLSSKEFERGNRVSFSDPCVNPMGGAILTVTYGGELLYLRMWRDH